MKAQWKIFSNFKDIKQNVYIYMKYKLRDSSEVNSTHFMIMKIRNFIICLQKITWCFEKSGNMHILKCQMEDRVWRVIWAIYSWLPSQVVSSLCCFQVCGNLSRKATVGTKVTVQPITSIQKKTSKTGL